MYAVKKPDKVDPHEQKLSKWLNCSLSNEPLREPIVIDGLGNLFNKEALVEALLKKRVPKGFGYIKGLRDLINVELSNGAGEEGGFMCPITGLEFNGRYRFVALRSCGHVLSAKAFKEVKSEACLVCRKEYKESDKIVINGNEEEVLALRERLEAERVKTKDGRKVKGKKGNGGGEDGVVEVERLSGKKRETEKLMEKVSRVNGKIEVKNVSNGSGTGRGKRFKAVDAAPAHANKDVYASIFTSSSKSDFKETYSCRSLPLGRN
ncbi:hypothetical protein Leryth_011032 [Lithospermum erythrorhizon]|nr:hypothetical protein Leryth_011032 [Lithospermum erythrorhizon]